jgi:hypothetical protein
MNARQLDFRHNEAPAKSGSLLGMIVRLPATCRCDSIFAAIEAGRDPHHAELRCGCGLHRGRISGASYRFLTEVIDRFGPPTSPIEIRALARMAAPSGAGAAWQSHPDNATER